jgi:CO dehydrogenase/acetyl-CoA synthase alpha subunit
MKIDQQRKLVYIVGALSLVAIFASSLIAGKYPEYTDYVTAGLGVCSVLLVAVAIFMIRSKAS